jgi:hypothetical protein
VGGLFYLAKIQKAAQYARWRSWGRGVDWSFWLGIIFFVLSVPMGFAINILTPRLDAFMAKRKLVKSNRTRAQDIAAYRSIEAFKNGTRDRYASYIGLAVLSIFFAIGGATCILLWVLRNGDVDANSAVFSPSLSLGLLSVAFFSLPLPSCL